MLIRNIGIDQRTSSITTTNHVRVISAIGKDTPNGAITLNFGMRSDIADIIFHPSMPNFVDRFVDFRLLILKILPFSTGLIGS